MKNLLYGTLALTARALLPLMVVCSVSGQPVSADGDGRLPVTVAQDGFTAEMSYRLRQGFSWETAYGTGDENLYYFLHWDEFVDHYSIARAGTVRTLGRDPDSAIGNVVASSSLGEMSLEKLIADPRSRIQGFLVVHEGDVVYERYPGMQHTDRHMWFSVSKTITALLLGMLEEERIIDVDLPIDRYLPELGKTNWRGIRVIDILDMASGLDVIETEEARNTHGNSVNQFFRLELGNSIDISDLDSVTSDEVLLAVARKAEPGRVFEYSSLNTRMLGILVERVAGQRIPDLIAERIWSKLGAEGDAAVAVNPQGRAGMYGLYSSRLRDMARYGMLYTKGWNKVAEEPVVSAALLRRIRSNCRPSIYASGVETQEGEIPQEIRCNSRQWDAVYDDGDIFKDGARGQGLYVSPDRDIVIAWFSTTSEGSLRDYARAIAKAIGP